ncbi:hypothetical protein Tco_0440259, partial [Tanacetum coccineum]
QERLEKEAEIRRVREATARKQRTRPSCLIYSVVQCWETCILLIA